MGVVRTSRAGSIVGLVASAALVLPVLQGISWALPPGPSDPCTVKGTDGPDTLTGTAGDDVICGRGGDDTINGLAGDDVIRAGDGNDVVNGGGGEDRIVGSAGDDALSGGDDADFVRGQDGVDLLIGGNGDDNLAGGADNDDVRGGPGADRVTGSADDDAVNGGPDNDVVLGRGGIDSLLGSTGDDDLSGGPGNDTVNGGDDADEVQGGLGDDQLLGGEGDDVLQDRDGAGFVDNAVCGAGSDQANVDVYDTVDADCEVRNNADRDAPVAVNDSATVVEDDPATAIDVRTNDTDADGGLMAVESVTQAGDGTVVITNGGDDLTYEPDPDFCNDPPGTTTDDFTYTLNGGSSATVAVTVTCEDDGPAAVDDSASVGEDDAATTIDVRANDTDVDGGTLDIGSVSQPVNGTVVITNGGDDLTYEPDDDYCNDPGDAPVDTFTYTLNGGDTATVSVTVTCVNDDPVATDDSATVTEDDAATAVDVFGNDIDVDGDIAIDTVTQPTNGTVVITGTGSGLTYEPDPDYCNSGAGPDDTFTYTLDGGSTGTVSMTVTCVDDAPVAVEDAADVRVDDPATAIDVFANDTDIDAGPKTITEVTQPADGTVVITAGGSGLTYEPDPGFCDDAVPDTFTYTLDGGSTATVSVTVECDVPPVAVDDSAAVDEDDPASTVDVLANDTDTDGGPISIDSVTQPADGTVVITNGGDDLTYEPDPDFCNDPPGTTTDDFTYTLTPGTSTATVTVTVTCADDDPVAVDDSTAVLEDATATAVAVLANDTDIDGGLLRITSASDPANGAVVLTGGSPGAYTGLTYEPDPNYCNDPGAAPVDTFTYTLNGGSNATVSVTVTCVDDPATIDNSAGNASYTENAAATVVDGNITITNFDGLTITTASASITGGFAAGQDALDWVDNNLGDSITEDASTDQTVLLTGNGTAAEYEAALEAVTYANSSNDPNTAPRTVTFSITTSAGSPSETKGLTVAAVDDPPVAVNDATTLLEDAVATAIGVLGNDTDADAGPKTISSASDPANGTVVLTGGSAGAHTGLTYQPDPNYCNNPPGSTPDTFTYTLNGGSSGTVSVTVTCVNDVPVADDETFNGASSAIGNTALVVNDTDDTAPTLNAPKKSITGDILAGDTDVDGPGPLTVTPGTFASNDGGTVTIEADGDFTFRPAASTSCTDASDFFDYTVEDSGSPEQSDVGRVTIAITGCVWYVNNNDATGNAGTSTAPFDTLAQAETASAAGHTIFVFDGDNTTTGYANGINLKANQVLTSEAANLVVGSDTLWTGVASARPTLKDNNADVVDLDDNTTVRGFVIDPQGTGGGIAGTTGDTGGGTIDNVSITDIGAPGSQPMLELDATTGTFNVSNFDVDTSGAASNPNTATGVRLNNAGTVVFNPTGTITVTTEGAKALDATGPTTVLGTSSIDAITVTASGVGAISLVNTTATALALGDDSGADLNLTTTGGTAFLLNNATNVAVGTGGTDEVHATSGPAIDITGAGNFTFDDTDSTNSTTDGINLDNFGTGTFTTGSASTISGPTGIGFDLNQGNANITYDGTISSSGSGRPVDVTNRGGGTVDFNGLITSTGLGVNLATNPAATIRFDGGLSLTTSTDTAFNATGGGTVVVTDPNAVGTTPDNTLAATSAAALNVVSTSIGAGNLTFLSISAGNNTAAADPANGIVLSSTGAAGSLVVPGNGGTCTSLATCTGGAIQNTTSHGISLTSTLSPSFTRIGLQNVGRNGVDGAQVTNFTFTNSFVSNTGTAAAGQYEENAIAFVDRVGFEDSTVSGTVSITGNTINQPRRNGIDIETWAGTISNLTIDNNTLTGGTTTSDILDAIHVFPQGSATTNAHLTTGSISNNTISGFRFLSGPIFVGGNGIRLAGGAGSPTNVTPQVLGTSAQPITIDGNAISAVGSNGIAVSFNGQRGSSFVNVTNNGTLASPMTNMEGLGISMFFGADVFTGSSAINNNFIGTVGPTVHAGSAGIGVQLDTGPSGATSAAPQGNFTVTNNRVAQPDGSGFVAIGINNAGVMDLDMRNNTVAADPFLTNRSAIRIAQNNATSPTICTQLSGNSTTGGSGVNQGIGIRRNVGLTIGVVGLPAGSTATPNFEAYINGQNPSGGGTDLISQTSGFSSCTLTP
jgi:hypothetical protein